jgi:thioredoxin-like negative regulator of GroEL
MTQIKKVCSKKKTITFERQNNKSMKRSSTIERFRLGSIRRILLPGFVLVFFCSVANGQQLQKIQKLYSAGKYAEVKADIAALVQKSPKNASYNQWYGVCLFETGAIEESEKYLLYASSKSVQESFRYLGRLYYLQYRFDESVKAYEQYIGMLAAKNDTAAVKAMTSIVKQSEKAARMLAYTEDIQVIDSVVIDVDKLLHYYMLSEESGNLTPSEGDKLFIHTNQLRNKRYYAKRQPDQTCKLYSQTKLMGVWADETALPPVVNESDTNYPFVLTDGVTLYFASKGQGSIGGYDLFVTRYNSSKETFLEPEQLGMPFNSIYNDYMLAIDDVSGIGFFATDRFQPVGKAVIYTCLLNQERKTIKTQDPTVLTERAKLTSIEATWQKGQNYGKMIEETQAMQALRSSTAQREFVFIVDDSIVYESLADFRSDAARSLFLSAQQTAQELNKSNRQLEKQRLNYSVSSPEARVSLSDAILKAEKIQEEISARYDQLILSARNTEIEYLKQHKTK